MNGPGRQPGFLRELELEQSQKQLVGDANGGASHRAGVLQHRAGGRAEAPHLSPSTAACCSFGTEADFCFCATQHLCCQCVYPSPSKKKSSIQTTGNICESQYLPKALPGHLPAHSPPLHLLGARLSPARLLFSTHKGRLWLEPGRAVPLSAAALWALQ